MFSAATPLAVAKATIDLNEAQPVKFATGPTSILVMDIRQTYRQMFAAVAVRLVIDLREVKAYTAADFDPIDARDAIMAAFTDVIEPMFHQMEDDLREREPKQKPDHAEHGTLHAKDGKVS